MNKQADDPVVLIVDDEKSLRLMVKAIMEDRGWRVLEAENGLQGLESLHRHKIDAVLADIRMPHMDGLEFLSRAGAEPDGPPVIMLTAYGSVDSAVEAMKMGAFDYLTKPADNEELIALLNRAAEYGNYLESAREMTSARGAPWEAREMIGESPGMKEVLDIISRVGPSEAAVLIQGESGTGKELAAEALHAAGPRAGKPLIKVNCAALPENLLESELFGYTKGAFTGANKDKPGRFQLAEKGTIFLDEIGEMSPPLQAKLLRALQEHEVEPLGGTRPQKIDVRVLAATNRNLEELIEKKEFREDLYYRLNVIEIRLPPLRERTEDIPPLTAHLLGKLARKNKKKPPRLSPQFLEALKGYSWPGNIRELENVLERGLIMTASDTLEPRDLPEKIRQNPEGQKKSDSLEEAEKNALLQALELNDYHREKTAEYLGVSRRTLQYKLRKYGLTRGQKNRE